MSGETIDNPAKFGEALASQRVIPGDTILLKPGTYKGNWLVSVGGTVSAPITIKPVTPGTVVIDGSIQTNLPYVTLQDLEIKYSGWVDRVSDSNPDTPGVTLNAQGCKVINCYIHDVFQGVSAFESAPGAEIYGCVIQNCGWDSVKGRGHGIYLQNQGNEKLVKHNLLHPGYSNYGIHAYYENGHLDNVTFDGNIHQGCIFLAGGHNTGAQGVVVKNNHVRGGYAYLGYTNPANVDIQILNNYFTQTQHSPWVYGWASAVVTGNKIYSDFASENPRVYRPGEDEVTWNNNAYGLSAANPFYFENNASVLTFAQWQALGFDLESTFSPSLPTTNDVILLPNTYNANRITVVNYNWQGLEVVSVNLGDLAFGNYRAHNSQDFAQDYFDFTYTGTSVDFPMTGHTVAVPTRGTARAETTFPTFGAFVLEKI